MKIALLGRIEKTKLRLQMICLSPVEFTLAHLKSLNKS